MTETTTPLTPQASRRVLRWGLGLMLALLVLLLVAVAAATALLRSEAGTAWLLARVPGVEAQGLRGALLGETLGADRISWKGDAGAVEIDALQLGDMRWTWRPSPHAWVGLHIGSLRATRVQWRTGAGDPNQPSEPPSMPASLQLPAEVAIALSVQTLQIDDQAPVQDLALELHAGADGGATHRIDALSLRWDKLRAQGRLQLAAAAPFALDSTLQLQSVDGAPLPWTADAKASGTLARLALEVALGSQTTAGRQAASMTLQAALTPFEPWPLADLSAHTEALDLSALSSQLPQTRLQGRALLRSKALDQPMQAELEVDNAAPGRWDEGRLPLRSLQLAIEATPTTPDRLAISRFDIRLGDAVGDAGRWNGQGQWQGSELTLDTRLTELAPQRLDSRAAPMLVGGPLILVVQHLPSPDPAASAPARAPELTLDTRLAGQVEGAPNPVQLELKARLSDGLLDVLSLQTRARGARAEMQASARRQGGIWSLESRGELVDFDPLPWWQGPAGSAWRSGTHRLNGDWTLALTLPQAATALPPLEMLSRLAGQGRVSIERSLLAGVPLEARIDVTQDSGTRLQARLIADGNQISLDGRAAALGPGADDRWQVDIDAPKLSALAPIAALHPASAGWAPRQGALKAELSAQGRWPSMRTEGRARVQALRTGPLALELGNASWSAATVADAPLSVQIDLDQLAWGEQSVPTLRATLSGSLRAHQLRASATLPLQPPPALAKSLALATGKGSRIALSADGEWNPGAEGSRWVGRVQQLAAGVWDGGKVAPDAPSATDWLDGRELRAEVELDGSGALRRLHADAGQLRLANTIALRWDDIEYAPQAGRTQAAAQGRDSELRGRSAARAMAADDGLGR
jgi:translocation and assembly module TamB